MGGISRDTIELIRRRCDIVEVVGAYLPLQRAGAAFRALCPFHKEKTPSFYVNPVRQIFHCFGCHAGGDVIRFVMEYERLDFLAAVRLLAERAGVAVQFDDRDRPERSRRELLLKLHEAAVEFFRERLRTGPGSEEARAYLKARRLEGEAERRFRIGWAPPGGADLVEWARRQGWALDLLIEGGLAVAGDRVRDRFVGRLMFPICDEQGRPIGFSGRLVRTDESGAKYVNTPETPLFHKGRILFALDKARRAILERRRAVLCEGQIDALRCHLAGLDHVVAAQGTAVTEDQARLLKRHADEVIVMLDADEAGREAAIRSARTLLAADLAVRLAPLPPGEDPDSLILGRGVGALQEILDHAESAVDFVARVARDRGELSGDAGRIRTTERLLEIIGSASSAVLRDQLLVQAAGRMGVPVAAMRRELEGRAHRHRRPANGAPPAGETAPAEAEPAPEELWLAEIAVHRPECRPLIRDRLRPRLIRHPLVRRVIELALDAGDGPVTWPADERSDAFERFVAAVEMSDRALRLEGEDASAVRATQDCILRLWIRDRERCRQEAASRMASAPPEERPRWLEVCQRHLREIAMLKRGWEVAHPLFDLME